MNLPHLTFVNIIDFINQLNFSSVSYLEKTGMHKGLQKITKSDEWPKRWKKEFVTATGKIPNPETEDVIGPILLSA